MKLYQKKEKWSILYSSSLNAFFCNLKPNVQIIPIPSSYDKSEASANSEHVWLVRNRVRNYSSLSILYKSMSWITELSPHRCCMHPLLPGRHQINTEISLFARQMPHSMATTNNMYHTLVLSLQKMTSSRQNQGTPQVGSESPQRPQPFMGVPEPVGSYPSSHCHASARFGKSCAGAERKRDFALWALLLCSSHTQKRL